MAETSISSDWVRHSQLGAGLERIEAYFGGHGYALHRHDTYALGLTLSGVQSFAYRDGVAHALAQICARFGTGKIFASIFRS